MNGSATGKLILCGEHAVVHGHPAIAVPVALRTHVEVTSAEGPLVIEHDLLSPRAEDRLYEALEPLFPNGGHLKIESELPVGVGLGSSAALAVAVGRALGIEEPELRETAMQIECAFHGDPSGLDVAVALRNEALWFVKGKPFKVIPMPPAPIVVIDSGTAGDTKQLVSDVAERMQASEAIREIIDDIGALVHASRAVLEDPPSLGDLLTENHQLLRALGVSTPELDTLCDLAIGAGALGAKLSGAGGGGVCLALVQDPEPVLKSAEAAGYEAWVVHDPR